MIECSKCGFWNNDYGVCTCPSQDMWYACPVENKKPENIQSLKEYTEWLSEYQGKWVAESEVNEFSQEKSGFSQGFSQGE